MTPAPMVAGEDRQEGAHLHQAVAADQFILTQRLRQDRVLHRPEQRRMRAHGEQRHQHQRQVIEQKARPHPTAMIAISPSLIRRISASLANFSPNCPASAENRKNGRINSSAHRLTQIERSPSMVSLIQNGEDQATA